MASLEKHRKTNNMVMLIGALVAVVGLITVFYFKVPGILILIAGIAILLLSWTVSNMFYRMDMRNEIMGKSKQK